MRALTTLTGAVLVAVLLGGCLPHKQREAPEPHPIPTPVFASEAEALAAAEDAYAAYVAMADQIFIEGGRRPERMGAVATGSFLKSSIEAFQIAHEKGWRSSGGTTFRGVSLQSFDPPSGEVTVYVCEDIAAVEVFDRLGASVVESDRPSTTIFQATLDWSNEDRALRVSERVAWSNETC